MEVKDELLIEDGAMEIALSRFPVYEQPVIPDEIVSDWKIKMKEKNLTVLDFKEVWKKYVPQFYEPRPESELGIIETGQKSGEILIDTIELFLADGSFEVEVQKLRDDDRPPSVCGRVFKIGEPTYSCRECGMDSTCVLCVGCFTQSPHRNHSYKMGNSSGGGCCDCGDVEAWRGSPYCDVHFLGTQVSDDKPPSMPAEMVDRCHIVFSAILRYAFPILTLQHSPSLPHDLRSSDFTFDVGSYCTVLYNDEIHTFEQVINTLTKIVKCAQKNSIEFVTNIDREGRAVVKCGLYQHCQDLKTDIERFTARHGGQALRVDVVHAFVIAHQVFAMRLLRWMQQILTYSESFRNVFSQVMLSISPPECSLVEGIMRRDTILWKSARTHWHRLIISGMLLEYSNKKALATVFTKNYGTIIKDYIRDDHDHSYSIASLSVQIFTVPTLTLHLIAEEDVLCMLLNTFLSECKAKLNKDSKLHFDRSGTNTAFKRAQYILYDLRYLLSTTPTAEQWTDSLRRGFLEGLSYFIKLMTYMEGMDASSRQINQHMEFELEWESAFNLHIKLAHVITMLLDWCGSDKVVLVKAFKLTLKQLAEGNKTYTCDVRELANHSASCIIYDVSTQPVSIHLPLSRFYAGLYLHLDKYKLSFDSPEIQIPLRPMPVQIMEPILRTQVLIGQVHAGMWRRNGYSILNQMFFYHNVRCRTEMLDRDINMMQVAASLIESDEFLIHLINKFGLMTWADPNYEDTAEEESTRPIISLVEELLSLLVMTVGERYMPGVGIVTPDERLKKEILQQLCIKPMSHSELNKTLPDDVNHETGLERVIDDVAVFKKPENTGKGVYELRPELYDQYNIYFYHYTREELSRSEDAQRKRRKAAGQLECCPPPQLPALAPPFEFLPNLLQCDVMMHILQTVLSRAANLRARTFSEHQLQKALHLIGYALQEEQSQRYPYLRFTEKSIKWGIEQLVAELASSARVESHKDMLLWVLEKFKVTKIETIVPAPIPTGDKDVKEWRAKMAAEKRAKIMAQMAAMQKSFMAGNAHLLEAMDCEAPTNPETEVIDSQNKHTCILCQQSTPITHEGPALVLCALLQKSTVHIQSRKDPDRADEVFTKPLFRPTSVRPQLHTSTCGHVMHSTCWQAYFDNVVSRESRRPYRLRQPTSFDVERQEYLCPLCECLGNTVLPLLPLFPPETKATNDLSFEQFIEALRAILSLKTRNITDTTSYHAPKRDKVLSALGEETSKAFLFPAPPELHSCLRTMMETFIEASYARGVSAPATYNTYFPVVAWNTISYTIHSTVKMLETQEKPLLGPLPLRHKSCLESLARCGGWMVEIWKALPDLKDQAINILNILLDESGEGSCLMDWDCFALLTPLGLSVQALIRPALPVTGSLRNNITLLIFYAQICKVLITPPSELELKMETEESEPAIMHEVFDKLQAICVCPLNNQKRNWSIVKRECVPFLRRCTVLYHYLHNRTVAGELAEPGGDTFENLCSYLGLPSTEEELLRPSSFLKISSIWLTNPRLIDYLPKSDAPLEYSRPNLVALPNDYSDLINRVSSFVCPNSDRDDSRNPTMCLVCGDMLCSQSYCCQMDVNKMSVGACTYHSFRCGAGVGLFLRIRECEILMLCSEGRGCFTSAPYLDRYGETDQGLRRGNPLTLCPERYRKLEKLWLGHNLYEEIARAGESSTNHMTTPWHHL